MVESILHKILTAASSKIPLFLLCLSSLLFAQSEIQFQHLTVDDGLSQNSGTAIMQDGSGFIWVGTQSGLNKYDGQHFQVFLHDPSDSTSPDVTSVGSISETADGNIWIASRLNGLDRLDINSGIFHHYQSKLEKGQPFNSNRVNLLYEDKKDVLWLGTQRGLVRFEDETETFSYFRVDSIGSRLNRISAIYEDAGGRFWVANFRQLFIFDRTAERFTPYALISDRGKELKPFFLVALHEDSYGFLWMGAGPYGLLRLNSATGKSVIYRHDPNDSRTLAAGFVSSIAEDGNANLWVGSESGGLSRVSLKIAHETPRKNIFTRYAYDIRTPLGLSSNAISSLCVDNSGDLWVGTGGSGLNQYNPNLIKFEHFKNDVSTPEFLKGSLIWGLLEDSQGRYWAAVEGGGVHRIDRRNHSIQIFKHDPSLTNSLSGDDVLSIAEDLEGNIWVGTRTEGLNKYQPESESFTHYLAGSEWESILGRSAISVLLVDKEGFLWIAASPRGGLIKFDPRTEEFRQFRHSNDDSLSLSSNRILCLFEDREETLWIGTADAGLNRFDRESGTFTHYRHQPGHPNSLGRNVVLSVAQDTNGFLWIGTDYGLSRFDPRRNIFKVFTTREGLPNNFIYGVLTDDSGRIWASTNRGLSRYDPSTKTFRNYTVEDGLQSSEFNANAYFKSPGGRMLFGGINGFNVFHPDSVRDNPYIPPVVITGIRKFDQHIDWQKDEPLRFSYKDDFIGFEFAALDYTNPKNNQYAYKLEGLQENWIACGHDRVATFTNLTPGEYVFWVKGSNNDGVWNETGTSLHFVVTPPYWQTWWFRTLSTAALFTLTLVVVYRWRERTRRKAELEQKFAELKLKALRSQMNPHFVFNTINSIQYFISSNEQKAAYNYLSKFSKLIRGILDNSDKATLTISEELQALKLYLELEKLRFEGKFNYDIELDKKIDIHNIEIPTLLIQPFVENAIQHGLRFKRTRGAINIKLDLVDDAIHCLIEDNGIGIEKGLKLNEKNNGRHKPTGMKVSQERLETLNALRRNGRGIEVIDLLSENGKGSGTRVKIVIPIETT